MKDTFGELNMLAQDLMHTYSSKPKKIAFPQRVEVPHTSLSFCVFPLIFFIAHMHIARLCTKEDTVQVNGM